MTGLTGPAPHPVRWASDRDVRLNAVAWMAVVLLMLGMLLLMVWPLFGTAGGTGTLDHDVSQRECVQTGGSVVVDPSGGGRTCVWPPSDF